MKEVMSDYQADKNSSKDRPRYEVDHYPNIDAGLDVYAELKIIRKKWNGADLEKSRLQRSEYFSFAFILTGEIRLLVNMSELTLQAGNIITVNPHVVRQVVDMSEDTEYLLVQCTHDVLGATGIHYKDINVLEFLSQDVNQLLRPSTEDFSYMVRLIGLLDEKLTEVTVNTYLLKIIGNLFSAFIYELGSLYSKQETFENGDGLTMDDLAVRFFRSLHEHIKTQRSVGFYAQQLHVTPKYLSSALKKIAGKTAGKYIEELVILEAKIFLGDPKFSISNIAGNLNFSDQFAFSKYFKKLTGLSPTAYRKNM